MITGRDRRCVHVSFEYEYECRFTEYEYLGGDLSSSLRVHFVLFVLFVAILICREADDSRSWGSAVPGAPRSRGRRSFTIHIRFSVDEELGGDLESCGELFQMLDRECTIALEDL